MNKENIDEEILLINPKAKWAISPTCNRVWPLLSLANSAPLLENYGYKLKEIAVHWSEKRETKVKITIDNFKMFLNIIELKLRLNKAVNIEN